LRQDQKFLRGVNSEEKKSQLDRCKEAATDVDADMYYDAVDKIMGKPDLTKKPEADEHKDD